MVVKRKAGAVQDFTVEELDRLPVIEPGSRLKPGEAYIDLLDPERAEMRARDGDIARSRSLYVAKANVARALWNRLRRFEPALPGANPSRRSGSRRA